ncbi:MAG TPA: four helix bundle protein [Chthoniobacterales bacterium]|nr:four helix bundle protein [Chthoniobacterales bacterium]
MSLAERLEDLRIWQQAREQVSSIYRCFRQQSPGYHDFSFRDQLQRASISVMNNIAEGFERKTPKDFAHFLDVAKGSCGELRSMLYVAEDLAYLSVPEAQAMRAAAMKLSSGIAALAAHLRS